MNATDEMLFLQKLLTLGSDRTWTEMPRHRQMLGWDATRYERAADEAERDGAITHALYPLIKLTEFGKSWVKRNLKTMLL